MIDNLSEDELKEQISNEYKALNDPADVDEEEDEDEYA